jgi:hypothetical protein
MHQGFGPSENSDPNLFGLKATGCLRLVAANEKLSSQAAQCFPDCDWSHSPTPFAQGD